MSKPSPPLWLRLLKLFAFYLFLCFLVTLFQRKLIYYPQEASEATLLLEAEKIGLLPWRNKQGHLIGWKTPPHEQTDQINKPHHRILVLHGNGGYALHRAVYAWCLFNHKTISWEVFLLEYPGYGAREGSPSETNNLQAAEKALNLLWTEKQQPVFLLGESLGSGIACQLASRFPDRTAGIFLSTPLNTLADVGAHHFWFLPIRLMLQESYDSVSALKKYQGPLVFILGENDEVIPKELGLKLYHSYSGPKKHWIIKGATHHIPYSPQQSWLLEAIQFLTETKPVNQTYLP